MEIRERAVGAITVLDPVGKLVLSEGQRDLLLRDTIGALLLQGRRQFVLDLAHVSQVDTSGLAMLVAVQVAVVKRGGQIRLLNPTRRLRGLLATTRLNTFFEVFDTEQEAIESFGSG
jgi:anti-sigma B factor antagonist